MIPDGWNSEEEASNNKHDLGTVVSAVNEKKRIPGVVRDRPESPNITLSILKTPWRRTR